MANLDVTTNAKTHRNALDEIAARVARANEKWWTNINTGLPIERNIGEMLMLSVTELAEAMEGHRKSLPDDKLPQFRMFDVEIVDCFIRLFDIAGHLIPDFGSIFEEKMFFNSIRHDHTIEGRKEAHGKKY